MINSIKIIIVSLFIMILGTSCATNTAMNSYSVSGPAIMIDSEKIESEFTIDGRISGEGSAVYLFGLFPLGDTHEVQGVWGGGTSFFSKDHAKMHATYDALTSSGADMIIEPRYEVVTKKTFLWTRVNAKVHGFKGVITSYNQKEDS